MLALNKTEQNSSPRCPCKGLGTAQTEVQHGRFELKPNKGPSSYLWKEQAVVLRVSQRPSNTRVPDTQVEGGR